MQLKFHAVNACLLSYYDSKRWFGIVLFMSQNRFLAKNRFVQNKLAVNKTVCESKTMSAFRCQMVMSYNLWCLIIVFSFYKGKCPKLYSNIYIYMQNQKKKTEEFFLRLDRFSYFIVPRNSLFGIKFGR